MFKRIISAIIAASILSSIAFAETHPCAPVYKRALEENNDFLIDDLYDYQAQKEMFDSSGIPVLNMLIYSTIGLGPVLIIEGGVQIANAVRRPYLRTMNNFFSEDAGKRKKAEKQLYRYAHGQSRLRIVTDKKLEGFRPVLENLRKSPHLLCPYSSVLSLSEKGQRAAAPFATGQEFLHAMHAQGDRGAIQDFLRDPSNFDFISETAPLEKKELIKLLESQI